MFCAAFCKEGHPQVMQPEKIFWQHRVTLMRCGASAAASSRLRGSAFSNHAQLQAHGTQNLVERLHRAGAAALLNVKQGFEINACHLGQLATC